jgi:hypothetical protein
MPLPSEKRRQGVEATRVVLHLTGWGSGRVVKDGEFGLAKAFAGSGLIQEPDDAVRFCATAVPAVRDGTLPVQVPCPTRLAQPWHLGIGQLSRVRV